MRIWQRPPILAMFFAIVVGAIAGCSNQEPTLLSPTPPSARFSEAAGPIQLVFISRSYDSELDETTFLYQLQNTPGYSAEAALTGIIGVFTDVTVELPACAPSLSSYFPTDGATIGTTVLGFNGIKWGVGYDENPDYYYSATFPGDVPQGVVRGLVETGGFTYIQDIAGPCAGTYQVAGTVFTDADGNGVQSPNELGISDVTVTLDDGESPPQEVKTDSDGNYIFIAMAGDYTVSIDSVTAASDFNETLFANWNATTPTYRQVTVGPDSEDNDFGFEPDVEFIIGQIDAGEYTTTGKSYKWWRKEFLRVLNGNENTAYTEQELLDFVHAIEALALLSEYDFTPGMELQEVYNILNNHAFEDDDNSEESISTIKRFNGRQDPYAFLLRELLTTELNHVSGRGLSDLQLQEVLVYWGEGVLSANAPSLNVFVLPGGDMPTLRQSPLEEGGSLFSGLNGATGGGGTN